MFDDRSGPGAALFSAPLSGLASPIRPGFVVAVPVKDEEERLPACLRALAQQRDQLGQPIPPTLVRIVVFANNCSDRSASLARKLGGGLSLDVRVVEARLPPAVAHAGSARRAVMDLAEAWLVEAGEKDGVILTTDADSQVAPNWIAENLAAFPDGAEAVLGRIDLDEEGAFLPEALHRRGGLEDTYERLLAELSWLLDPLDHNPWPHHATISGASLGVTRAAYCRVGRLPRVPLGEDKALIGLVLTESQLAALEKAKSEKEAHGEFESECPGYCGAQDTFYVGNMKGVGRIYQQTFIDTYAKVAFAKLYDRKTPITAADLVNDRVVPFYDAHEVKLCRVLTDRGTEYCGNPEIMNMSSTWRSRMSITRALERSAFRLTHILSSSDSWRILVVEWR